MFSPTTFHQLLLVTFRNAIPAFVVFPGDKNKFPKNDFKQCSGPIHQQLSYFFNMLLWLTGLTKRVHFTKCATNTLATPAVGQKVKGFNINPFNGHQ
jgi:hypothetical protein